VGCAFLSRTMGYVVWKSFNKKVQQDWARRLRVDLKAPKKEEERALSLPARLSAREDQIEKEMEALYKMHRDAPATRAGKLIDVMRHAQTRFFNDGDSLAEVRELDEKGWASAAQDEDVWEAFPDLERRARFPVVDAGEYGLHIARMFELMQATIDRMRAIEAEDR